ncbi:MAG TPA: bifunctional oligoribonuclease/PAP phosphatase NrnA [Clostridia bacterium]|nr:bifunctional oligoribonuclease/PAP phosphatase NrnA [Clostridia bacterium]
MLARIGEALSRVKGALITAHERPDGDAIGSAIALDMALRYLGIRTVVMLSDPVPDMYRFLKGTESILMPSSLGWKPEAVVALDSTEWDRVGEFIHQYLPGTVTINIDHHASNREFADLNWVDINAAATGEMVLDLIEYLQVPIDMDAATALYTAMATDTGFFQHGNTTAKVLSKCARLAELGANPHFISEQIHEYKSFESLKALGFALSSIQLSPKGSVAWIGLSLADMERLKVKEEELEGFVNYPRSIKGVEVGILFRQVETNKVRVGLRSRGQVDVSAIAQAFGGGGHYRAAGCTVAGDLDEVIEEVVKLCCQRAGEF